MKVLFGDNTKDWLLDVFDKTIDSDGFIIEKLSKDRIITPEGEELTIGQLAIIKKGSEKFIAGDLTSLLKHTKGEI